MQREWNSRRSFLLTGMAAATGVMLAGCGGEGDKAGAVTKQDQPEDKAKESMDYYKNNNLKKKK